jgi:hypothetical protein
MDTSIWLSLNCEFGFRIYRQKNIFSIKRVISFDREKNSLQNQLHFYIRLYRTWLIIWKKSRMRSLIRGSCIFDVNGRIL